jgi:HK97 gp10 family phage protein
MAKPTGMKMVGAEQLMLDMKHMGPAISKRASNAGIRKAAVFLRKAFREGAPKVSGNLRRAIRFKYYPRTGRAYVGIRTLFYYNTLEWGRKGGQPLHPFFEKVWNRNRKEAANIIISATNEALFVEAGKVRARSVRRSR